MTDSNRVSLDEIARIFLHVKLDHLAEEMEEFSADIEMFANRVFGQRSVNVEGRTEMLSTIQDILSKSMQECENGLKNTEEILQALDAWEKVTKNKPRIGVILQNKKGKQDNMPPKSRSKKAKEKEEALDGLDELGDDLGEIDLGDLEISDEDIENELDNVLGGGDSAGLAAKLDTVTGELALMSTNFEKLREDIATQGKMIEKLSKMHDGFKKHFDGRFGTLENLLGQDTPAQAGAKAKSKKAKAEEPEEEEAEEPEEEEAEEEVGIDPQVQTRILAWVKDKVKTPTPAEKVAMLIADKLSLSSTHVEELLRSKKLVDKQGNIKVS